MANHIEETKGRFGERVIIEYDEYTGKTVKNTFYRSNGKTIDYISEFDQDTGKQIKKIYYKKSFFQHNETIH
ncbi:DUF2963 domain-containing protein [Candidatus Phytoplasma solani]